MISEATKKKMAGYFDRGSYRILAFRHRPGGNAKAPEWLESLAPALLELDFMRDLEDAEVGYVLFEARSGKWKELYVTIPELYDSDVWVSFRKEKLRGHRLAWNNKSESGISIIVWSHAGQKYLVWDLHTPYSSPDAAAQATLKCMRSIFSAPIGGPLVGNDEIAIEVFTTMSNYDLVDLDATTPDGRSEFGEYP